MTSKDKASGMKSAYELALERLESQGIDRPREEALSAAVKEKMAAERQRAEAKLAELEILHRDKLKKLHDPAQRREEEEGYRRDRRRLEGDLERKIEKLRGEGGG